MTKLREPLTVEHVLSQVISKLEEDEVKNITNKSISHFRKCSDPDDKDHNLQFNDAVMLDILMQRKSLGTPFVDNFSLLLEYEFNKYTPDLVIVQGDTTTAFVAALASFYKKILVGHVEAGLRTNNIYDPYPEELNRRLISQIANLHFSPTLNSGIFSPAILKFA